MHELHYLLIGANSANILILVALMYIYVKNYLHIKSKYNMGLLVFSLLFLIENLIALHLAFFSWVYFEYDIIGHVALINSIQFLGLLSLLYITWK